MGASRPWSFSLTHNIKWDKDFKIIIAAKKAKTPPLHEIFESTATTEESDINIFNKDLELLSNTLRKSPLPS